MTGMRRFLGAVVAVGLLGACEPLEDDGGGGGAGDVLFDRGFAFVREDDRNVFVVDDDGDPNSPEKLTDIGGVYWPSVSRGTGRSVVFVQRSGSSSMLMTVPTSGGVEATLLQANDPVCPRGCNNFRTPVFSPSGTSVVFVFNPSNSSVTSLGVVNTDGSGFRELTPNTTISYGAPSFLPDGSAVVAPAGSSLSNLNQIARVPLNGGSPIINTLSGEVSLVANRVAVSPNGTQVVFDGRLSSGGQRIFVAPLTASGVGAPRRVTVYTGTAVQETWPSWTSNTQVGFLFVDASGSEPGIYRATVGQAPGSATLAVPSAAEPSYGPI